MKIGRLETIKSFQNIQPVSQLDDMLYKQHIFENLSNFWRYLGRGHNINFHYVGHYPNRNLNGTYSYK